MDRLRQWHPNVNASAPMVTYGFDDVGNLRSRSVSDETVTYQYRNNSVLEQLTTVRSGSTTNEAYLQDGAGLLRQTPQGVLTYTSFDKPLTFQGSSGSFQFKYDAFGNRVARTNTASSEVVLSVGRLYERRTSPSTTEHVYRVGNAEQTVAEVTMGTGGTSVNYLLTDIGGVVTAGVDQGAVMFRAPRRDPFVR